MTSIVSIVLLFFLLGGGAWIGLGLMGVGVIGLELFRSVPVERILAQTVWNGLTSPELLALPLFILMSELLFRSRFTEGLFYSLEPWVRRLPGRLLHTNVLGCAFFALISGSSAATTSAVGKVTLGELQKRGYPKYLAIGSLAGSGTLGFLIPPSIVMIIYGVLSQTSVLQLFAAGFIPGALLALLFMIYVAVVAGRHVGGEIHENSSVSIWKERIERLPSLLPFIVLMGALLGTMYGGLTSPSEAAVLGVVVTMVIMAIERTLTVRNVSDAGIGTARTMAMLGLIIGAASFLSAVMGYLGLPREIAAGINKLHLSPLGLVALLLVIYGILGCFLEGMSMIVMTLPIVLPLVVSAGYSKVWFGIFLVVAVEMAQITPPVGMNLFVIQGLTGESLGTISKFAFPFFVLMVVYVFLLAIFPQIVTILPSLLFGAA